MHVFSLGENEAVFIGEDIIVRVVAIQNDSVQIEVQYSGGVPGKEEHEEYQLTTDPTGESGWVW